MHLWGLVDFDKIFYIDADCLVVAKDPLFESVFRREVDFAAAPDVFPPDHFNAGVLYLKPSLKRFAELLKISKKVGCYDGGDTGLLNKCYPDWFIGPAEGRLDFGFNA